MESERTCIVCRIRHPMYGSPQTVDVKESEIDPRESLTQNMLLGKHHDNRCALEVLTFCESK